MKIIGTYEEICAMNSFLLNNHPVCCQYQQPWIDLDGSHYSGKWRGFDIDFEIQKKPMTIGMIVPSINRITNLVLIAEKHGTLSFAQGGIPNVVNEYRCKNGTRIFLYNSFAHLRGHKFDELWMESLPSDWDEFDLCISSVMGKRENIHFFKELKTNKEAE